VFTHTGVFPACDRVTRIDMAAMGVELVARCFRGIGLLETAATTRQDDGSAVNESAQEGNAVLESHSQYLATAADQQCYTKCEYKSAMFVDVSYKF
jgi:hypothetical protein